MTKRFSVVMLLIALLAIVGCSQVNQSATSAPLYSVTKSGLRADLEVGGKISGTASGTILFGFIPLGFPNKLADGVNYAAGAQTQGVFEVFGQTPIGTLKAGAAYEAITKSGADVIVAPKYVIEGTNMFIFQTVTVTVTGFKGTIKSFKNEKECAIN